MLKSLRRLQRALVGSSTERPAARAMGMQIQIMNARTRREIDAAFQTIARERHDALLVGSDSFFRGRGAASLE